MDANRLDKTKLVNRLMDLYDFTGDRAEKYAYGRIEQEVLSGIFDIDHQAEIERLNRAYEVLEEYVKSQYVDRFVRLGEIALAKAQRIKDGEQG